MPRATVVAGVSVTAIFGLASTFLTLGYNDLKADIREARREISAMRREMNEADGIFRAMIVDRGERLARIEADLHALRITVDEDRRRLSDLERPSPNHGRAR